VSQVQTVSEDAFERLARRRASGEITDAEYGRQLERLIVLQERVRFFRRASGRERRYRRLLDDVREQGEDE